MKPQLKKLKVLLVFPLLLVLAGCWDQVGLDRQVFVIGIGLDKSEEKGKIEVTYLIANPEVGTKQSGGAATNEPSGMTVTLTVSDFISMRNIANSVVAREISYDLLRVIFVSEELAKEEEFIRFLYTAEKDREIKRDVKLVVTKEKVQEFFKKNKPKFLSRPHKYYEFMINRGVETGITPNAELHHFFRITEEDANLFLAIYATNEITKDDKFRINEMDSLAGGLKVEGNTNTAQFLGAAVFHEGKMIGTLTGMETRIVMLLNETFTVSDVLTEFPDPFNEEYQISVRLMKNKDTRVTTELKAKPPRIDVTLPLTMDVLTDPGMENPVENKKKVEKLRKAMEKYMEEAAMEVVRKSQEEFKAEPFGWSLYARKEFKTLKEYMDFDWTKTYPDMKVNLDVELRFGKFGRQPKTPGYKGIRD